MNCPFEKKIQVIISRLIRNGKTEKLNSEATEQPAKSFWNGKAEKSKEVMVLLKQALEKE